MFSDPSNPDPLGLGVKGRARERRLKMSMQGLQPVGGPLPDQNWDAFFQASDEAGGGRPTKFAYWDQPQLDLTRDPRAIAAQPGNTGQNFYSLSQQLGTRADTPLQARQQANYRTPGGLAALRMLLKK